MEVHSLNYQYYYKMNYKVEIHNTFGFHRDIFLPEPVEIWIDLLPNTEKTIKRILLLVEPDEISNLKNEVINSRHKDFDLILTHNSEILEKCVNSHLHLFGTCWIKNFNFSEKEFSVTTLIGGKTMTQNHHLRHKLVDLINIDSKIKCDFFNSINNPFNDERLLKMTSNHTKNELFYSQFHIVIENSCSENWFTEKLIDCFQTKTIPIYLGCPNIHNWFETEGMFIVNSIEDIKNVLLTIDENTYQSKITYVENNYNKSQNFVDFGIMIEDKLKKLLN
jgi:hypothetical protein